MNNSAPVVVVYEKENRPSRKQSTFVRGLREKALDGRWRKKNAWSRSPRNRNKRFRRFSRPARRKRYVTLCVVTCPPVSDTSVRPYVSYTWYINVYILAPRRERDATHDGFRRRYTHCIYIYIYICIWFYRYI